MNIYFNPDSPRIGIDFPTFGKAKWIAEFLEGAPVEGARLVRPEPCSVAQAERVHDSDYVDVIIHGGPGDDSNGFTWTPRLWPSVAGSTGGVIAAVLEALRTGGISGALASGLHHARAGRGSGYCTLNGIVIAVREAMAEGAQRIVILDVDAHCGGGTASLIEDIDGVEQVDVSVNRYDWYPSTPQSRLTIVEEAGADGATYLAAIEAALEEIGDPSSIDVMILNAGVDPHEGAGGMHGITDDVLDRRERMIFDWANRHGVPVAWVLAGGYLHGVDQDGLVGLHLQTVRAAAEAQAARAAAAA